MPPIDESFPATLGAGAAAHPPSRTSIGAHESALVDRYRERVRLFAIRRLGDARHAEDVAQETLRRVIQALRDGRVDEIDALPGFVLGTAYRVCLQHRRSAWREWRALLRLERSGDGAGAPAPPADPLAELIAAERRALVRGALEQLRPGDRELLRMLYFDRLEASIAAARLATTVGALRVRKHRALRRLGELLGTAMI